MDPLSTVLALLKPRTYRSGGFDVGGSKSPVPTEVVAFFEKNDVSSGGRLVTFGWAMAEDLAAGRLGGH